MELAQRRTIGDHEALSARSATVRSWAYDPPFQAGKRQCHVDQGALCPILARAVLPPWQPRLYRNWSTAMISRCSLLFTALVASLMLGQVAHADGLSDITERGTLRVAVPQDFPPFGSVGPDMQPRGLDIDTAKLIADQLKVKLQLTPVNSTNRIPYLTTGKVDLVISSLGKNAEREQVIDFSSAYAPFYLAVFGPPEAPIATLDDLKGKTISVTRGAIEDIELSKVAPEGLTIKRFEDNNSTIAAYLAGQTDLIASGNVVMVAISEKNPKRIPALKIKLKDSPVYVGINKQQPELLSKVNQIIAAGKSDGTLEKNAQTWLKQPLPADL